MHRKFIALIVGLAILVTAVSAAPAKADEDLAKFLAGFTALAIIGAAIHDSRDDDSHSRSHYVAPQPHRHKAKPQAHSYQPRPLPQSVSRHGLPRHCVRTAPKTGNKKAFLSRNCLQNRYGGLGFLPKQCKVRYWNGDHARRGYDVRCLKSNGYRLSQK